VFNNVLKSKLKKGIPCLGNFHLLRNSTIIEICGMAGLDFVIVDMEHFGCSFENLEGMVKSANLTNISILVRIPFEKDDILRVVDSGVSGIILPHLKNAHQLQEVIRLTKYSPEGMRGVTSMNLAALFGEMPIQEYIKSANENILIGAMIEDKEAVDNLDEIFRVPGLDLIFVGEKDLSQSLTGSINPNHPDVEKTISYIIDKSKKIDGLASGVLGKNAMDAQKWIKKGATFFAIDNDVRILATTI